MVGTPRMASGLFALGSELVFSESRVVMSAQGVDKDAVFALVFQQRTVISRSKYRRFVREFSREYVPTEHCGQADAETLPPHEVLLDCATGTTVCHDNFAARFPTSLIYDAADCDPLESA